MEMACNQTSELENFIDDMLTKLDYGCEKESMVNIVFFIPKINF